MSSSLSGRPAIRRTALWAALATGAATLVALPLSPASQASAGEEVSLAGSQSVDLTGTLLITAGESGEPDTYAVQRPNGQVVPIKAGDVEALEHATGFSRFSGQVSLPVVNGRATSLRAAANAGRPLTVTEARVNPRPTTSAPVAHRVAVAMTKNLGDYSLTPAQILAQIKGAADYWVDQADGKITGFTLPAATGFVPYNTTKTTVASGCGIGGDQVTAPEFDPVVQEAATLFPGYDFVNGTDLLVVLMPDACTQTFAGRGSLGDSVVSGGVSIVGVGAYMGKTVAHEWGHNFGLAHANTNVEYGDIYEVMGSAPNTVPPELGTGYRHEQGLLQAGEVANLTGRSASAVIRDRAVVAETGVRGAEVIDPDTGARLWFDLRTGTGSDAGAAYRNTLTAYGRTYRPRGVVVEEDNDRGLLLQIPGGNTSLIAGETWSNASGSMRVRVAALDATAGTATLASTYAPGAPVAGGAASVGGEVRAFETVQAVGTGFSPVPAGLRYQWFLNGTPIPNEEGASLPIPLAWAGAALSVQITAYASGRAPATVTSAPVTVAGAKFYARGVTAMAVSGAPKTGQVLTAAGLDWVGFDGEPPSGLTSSFQWYRGQQPIPGATGASYQLVGADFRQYIAVRNIPAAPGYETTFASSRFTSPIDKGKIPAAKPKIKFKGKKAKPGTKLKAKPGTWVSKTKFRFQWYAGGKRIRGATKKTFVPGRGLRKKKITVKVTGSKNGYLRTARKSSAVKIK